MKTLKKLLVPLVAVAVVVLCISATPVLADYSFGSSYTDYLSVTSSSDLGNHKYEKRDIGASKIYATAPSGQDQDYLLNLYTRNWGSYEPFGSTFLAGTKVLNGSCWWDNANPNNYAYSYAYILLTKKSNNSVSLGGYIESKSRLWM